MNMFHKGIFTYLGPDFQASEVAYWNYKHKQARDYDWFVQRISEENRDAIEKNDPPVIDAAQFIGSLGAVDGTYSVRPSVSTATLNANNEDVRADRMYSEYIKMHAYKLVLLCSHGLTHLYPKLILAVTIGCGSAPDTGLYTAMLNEIDTETAPLNKGAVFLGDNAFHRAKKMVVPYNATQITMSGEAHHCNLFNHQHSTERMTSEHAVKFMKYWGAVRGRDDIRLFEKEETYQQTVFVAQALHNYKALNCPEFV